IGAARLELKDAVAGRHEQGQPTAQPRRRAIIPWVLLAAASCVAGVALSYALRARPEPDGRGYRAVILPPSPLSGAPALRLGISPDGRRVAFVAPDSTGNTVLWVRGMDEAGAHALPGTVNAAAPFWSPDGASIAFFADGQLRRIDANGGPVQILCAAPLSPPGAWNREGVIIYAAQQGPLLRVPATGGEPAGATEVTPN